MLVATPHASVDRSRSIEHQSMLAFEGISGAGGKATIPQALNLGDCAAYALAKSLDAPLLFKGDDFRAHRRAARALSLASSLLRTSARRRSCSSGCRSAAGRRGRGGRDGRRTWRRSPRCAPCRGWCRSWSSTASSLGAQNEGQPEPLSYLVLESNNGSPQPAQRKTPVRFSLFSGLVKGALGAVLAQHVVLQRIELLLPLRVGFFDTLVAHVALLDGQNGDGSRLRQGTATRLPRPTAC